jgi:hypothetical protein
MELPKFSGLDQLELTPPHDITGKETPPFFPELAVLKAVEEIESSRS